MPGTEDNPVLHPDEPSVRHVTVNKLVLTRAQKLAGGIALLLCVGMSGGALVSQQVEQHGFEQTIATGHAQRVAQEDAQARKQAAANAALEQKLCDIFMPIASLKAPAGDASNPSRVFEQNLETKLALVAPALECKK